MFKSEVAPVVVSALTDFGSNSTVCEKALWVIAVLCRHSDDDKLSVSYENAKALGNAGACELIAYILSLPKYADDLRVSEIAFDCIRSLCCLESNRARFASAQACEIVGRCLTKHAETSVELCSWICRVLGHLANG